MGELGLLSMLVAEHSGGTAADTVSYAIATLEFAAADGAASTAFQVHNALVNVPIPMALKGLVGVVTPDVFR